jgi:hypothetical protein
VKFRDNGNCYRGSMTLVYSQRNKFSLAPCLKGCRLCVRTENFELSPAGTAEVPQDGSPGRQSWVVPTQVEKPRWDG